MTQNAGTFSIVLPKEFSLSQSKYQGKTKHCHRRLEFKTKSTLSTVKITSQEKKAVKLVKNKILLLPYVK